MSIDEDIKKLNSLIEAIRNADNADIEELHKRINICYVNLFGLWNDIVEGRNE